MYYCYYDTITGQVKSITSYPTDWMLGEPNTALLTTDEYYEDIYKEYLFVVDGEIIAQIGYYIEKKLYELSSTLEFGLGLVQITDDIKTNSNEAYKLIMNEHGWQPTDDKFILGFSHGMLAAPTMSQGLNIINLVCQKENEIKNYLYDKQQLIKSCTTQQEIDAITFDDLPSVDLRSEIAEILS